MAEKWVLKLNEDGNIAIENGRAVKLTGVEAVKQNIRLQLLMQRRQGYLGKLWRDREIGLKWRRYHIQDLEPALLGDKVPAAYIAMAAAIETSRVPGVNRVLHAEAHTPTDAQRANREVQIALRVLVGTEEYPTPIYLEVSQSLG